MQRRTLALLTTSGLVLSACSGGLLGGPNSGPDVSGHLLNGASGASWPSNTRLALIGVNEAGLYNNGGQAQVAAPKLNGGYDMDLPLNVPQGIYRVIAYVDGSNGQPADGQYQLGETVSNDNGKYLVYSNSAFTAFGRTFGAGWNLYNSADLTVTPVGAVANGTFGGYDLSFPN